MRSNLSCEASRRLSNRPRQDSAIDEGFLLSRKVVRIIRGAEHLWSDRGTHPCYPFFYFIFIFFLFFPFFRWAPEGIRRTSNFGTAAAYVGAGNERDSGVSLVLVTFLSSGTACHVNLPFATIHHGVRLLFFVLARLHSSREKERLMPRSLRTDGWTDSRTSARCVKEKYNRRP